MLSRWSFLLLVVCWGCGIDDRGTNGGPASEADAGTASDTASASADAAPTSADATADAPVPHDLGLPAPDAPGEPSPCGVCTAPANGTAACVARQCVLACNSGFHLQGKACAANDAASCCGPTCAICPSVSHGTAQCRAGACDVVCDAGFHREGAACAMDDNAGCCGSACTKCVAPANAAPLCKAGQCSFTCNPGFHAAGGACLVNDDLACCGPTCQACTATRPNAAPVCAPSGCANPSPCLTTHHDCNGTCVANDAVASCGAACTPCPDRPNATVTCNGGACVYACAPNFDDCDGNPNNGCEANLLADPDNCGACAKAAKDPHICGGGSHQQVCVNGHCGCPAGWGNCNGDASDGCEVNLLTSNVHCGACNPRNPSELDLLTEETYKAANADPACRVYKLETCEMGHCK